MKDHNYIREDGTRVPVSKMNIEDIVDILHQGGVVIEDEEHQENQENVLERLRIELLIRELNL
jgi:hypothetical protein